MDLNKRITPHFRWAEFIDKGDNPNQEILDNIRSLAWALEMLRTIAGKPIKITSGYRNPQKNKSVGGAPSSTHLRGMAADFYIPGMTPKEVFDLIPDWTGGFHAYEAHLHIDIRGVYTRW